MATQLSVALAAAVSAMPHDDLSSRVDPPLRPYAQGEGMHHLLARHFGRGALVRSLAQSGAPRLRVNGKPVCISLSHTACALAVASAPSPIGVDVEASHRLTARPARAVALATRLWPPQLASALLQRPEQERGALFVRLWTLFEATAKRAETGIWRTAFSLSHAQLQVLFEPMAQELVWLPRERSDGCALATLSLSGGVTVGLAAQTAVDIRPRVHAGDLRLNASLEP